MCPYPDNFNGAACDLATTGAAAIAALEEENRRNQGGVTGGMTMNWYDIKDCPRNGTKILCYSPGNKNAKITRARKALVTVDAISPRYPYFKHEYPEAPYTLWTPIVMPE